MCMLLWIQDERGGENNGYVFGGGNHSKASYGGRNCYGSCTCVYSNTLIRNRKESHEALNPNLTLIHFKEVLAMWSVIGSILLAGGTIMKIVLGGK